MRLPLAVGLVGNAGMSMSGNATNQDLKKSRGPFLSASILPIGTSRAASLKPLILGDGAPILAL